MAMHGLHEGLHVLGRGELRNPVPEVENVPRAAPEALENALCLAFDRLRRLRSFVGCLIVAVAGLDSIEPGLRTRLEALVETVAENRKR